MRGKWMGECTSTGHKNSRKLPLFATAVWHCWVSPAKLCADFFSFRQGQKREKNTATEHSLQRPGSTRAVRELSFLLERDELPILPILTFALERNLQIMLCCLLLPHGCG